MYPMDALSILHLEKGFNTVSKNRKGCRKVKGILVITGAGGHLGNTILRLSRGADLELRGLVLPGEDTRRFPDIHYVEGDVRDEDSLRPLFENTDGRPLYLVHTAGRIDISQEVSPELRAINVDGTKNLLKLCGQYRVERMVYVSSVHAIPEAKEHTVLREVTHFSADQVVGGYAKTKAEATEEVLKAAREGLPAVVVQPSGILGPYDTTGNHLVQMVSDYLRGKLPACVRGGYDFVDVRDVASGCLAALTLGTVGECYILSNRRYEIRDVLEMVRRIAGGRKLPVLPIALAKMAAPAIQWRAKRRGERPLYTSYSLHTLGTGDQFSHEKATRELGYHPRDLFLTLRDTVLWMRTGKRFPAIC